MVEPILKGVLSGLVIVDKPQGWTSHDVVARMRRLAGTRKVGHAGTLDPMATGVLVLGINKATRLLTYIVGTGKRYSATIRLGQSTITDDAEGDVSSSADASALSETQIRDAVAGFLGEIQQVPSSVSAIKVNGERSYARVRSGQEVTLAARPVTITRFDVLEVRAGGETVDVDVDVLCSSGTYIRALARDLGAELGVGGHLTALRRHDVGPFALAAARTLEELAEDFSVLDLAEAARMLLPVRELSAEESEDLRHGRRIARIEAVAGSKEAPVAAFAPDGELIALLADSGRHSRPVLVFPPDPEPAAQAPAPAAEDTEPAVQAPAPAAEDTAPAAQDEV